MFLIMYHQFSDIIKDFISFGINLFMEAT